eukprot:gb/GEZN01008886.1/.p1 GENE.gb/GEZN01008886.1/~~gb/GEZN01008886.1/.p1  ORF type:complete len:190 (-),score=12.55 gb/GEZN01008886.1/:622-1191(-)
MAELADDMQQFHADDWNGTGFQGTKQWIQDVVLKGKEKPDLSSEQVNWIAVHVCKPSELDNVFNSELGIKRVTEEMKLRFADCLAIGNLAKLLTNPSSDKESERSSANSKSRPLPEKGREDEFPKHILELKHWGPIFGWLATEKFNFLGRARFHQKIREELIQTLKVPFAHENEFTKNLFQANPSDLAV